MMAVAIARPTGGNTFAGPVVFRPDFAWQDQAYFERRQAFLRSYQLGGGGVDDDLQNKNGKAKTGIVSRCASTCAAARRSLARVRRAVGSRLRSARRYRRLVWARLRRHARRAIWKVRLGGTESRRRRLAVTGLTARDWFGTPARYYYW